MFQFVRPEVRRTSRLAPVLIALAVMFVPVAAFPQTTPAPAPAPTATPPQTTPPAKADAPPADAPPPAAPATPGAGKKGKKNRPPAAAPGEPADLEAVMHGIADNAKLLNGALVSEDEKVALNSVIEMERFAALAKKFEPNNMATVAEADRPAHVIAFRKQLIALLKQLTEIEASVLDGKFAPAMEMMRSVTEMRDNAHDKFQAKKERH